MRCWRKTALRPTSLIFHQELRRDLALMPQVPHASLQRQLLMHHPRNSLVYTYSFTALESLHILKINAPSRGEHIYSDCDPCRSLAHKGYLSWHSRHWISAGQHGSISDGSASPAAGALSENRPSSSCREICKYRLAQATSHPNYKTAEAPLQDCHPAVRPQM